MVAWLGLERRIDGFDPASAGYRRVEKGDCLQKGQKCMHAFKG
jgi:hypothetical protein